MTEPVAIPFPQMGVSVDSGTVLEWLKTPGDAVTVDEPVCAISTDKVDTEVYAPIDGILAEILVAAGDSANVGAPLAMLTPVSAATADSRPQAPTSATQTAGGNPPSSSGPPAVAGSASVDSAPLMAPITTVNIGTAPAQLDYEAEAEAAVSVGDRNGVLCSPVARRIAMENSLDLSVIAGSGRGGRITKVDVLAALETRQAVALPTDTPQGLASDAPPSASVTPLAAMTDSADGPSATPRGYEDVPFTVVPTSTVRRAIAEHMRHSRDTAAHMTTEVEVDMHRITEVRGTLNRERTAAGQAKLSFLPFIARAACAVLQGYPDLNATFDGSRLIRWREVNLGIAVDTDRGLLAPVIRGCERLTVAAIADQIATLAARARDRTLTPDDMRAGTFTLSNPGSVGAVSAHAIINQPQVAILGTPAIIKRPVIVAGPDGTDLIAIRPIMLMALTFDHRAVDGAYATRCAVAIKKLLEAWDSTALS
jgi:pyruvate dehydrogenase E2 component (dihydrolipoamide acetyltransferase)